LADSLGRPAPPSILKSETIPEGWVLVMSEDEPKGFDSRYFGLIPESSLTYVDEILIFDL
jgi:type IV secretory pathway protease TraF